MKTILKIFIVLLASSLTTHPATAQNILKRIQRNAEKSVEQRATESVNKRIDKKIDDAFDKLDESLERDKDSANVSGSVGSGSDAKRQQRMAGILKGMGMSGEPVPFEDNYAFDYLIQMHIENYKKSGKLEDTGDINTHFSPNSKSMAYEVVSGDLAKQRQGMFIIDAENGAMIILNDENGEKQGIIYGIGAFFESMGETYNQEGDLPDSPETYLANPNVTKTGRTKTVSGYNCEEYKFNDENTESEIWIAKDLKMNTHDFFSTLFKTSMYVNGMGWGYPMETTSLDKNSGEKSVMQVTKVDKNSNVKFSMNDYQVTNLGSFTMPAEEQEEKDVQK